MNAGFAGKTEIPWERVPTRAP